MKSWNSFHTEVDIHVLKNLRKNMILEVTTKFFGLPNPASIKQFRSFTNPYSQDWSGLFPNAIGCQETLHHRATAEFDAMSFPLPWYIWKQTWVSKVVMIWVRLEGMNCCIFSRLLDQFLVARIDPEPCACVQLACASWARAALAWSSTVLIWSSRVSWIKIDFSNFANLTSQSALVKPSASISSVGQ